MQPVTQQKLKDRSARPKFSTSIPGVSDKVCDDGIWCDRKGRRRTGRGAPRRRYELLKRQSVLEELSLVLNSNKRELSTKTGTVMHRGSITGIFLRVCFHKRPVWLCFRHRRFVLKSLFIFPLGREQNTHTPAGLSLRFYVTTSSVLFTLCIVGQCHYSSMLILYYLTSCF